MIEKLSQVPRSEGLPKAPEIAPHTGDDRIMLALNDLDDESLAMWTGIMSTVPYPYSDLVQWVENFNKYQKTQGSGLHDPSLPGDQRETDTKVVHVPFNERFKIQIQRTWDGRLSLVLLEQ